MANPPPPAGPLPVNPRCVVNNRFSGNSEPNAFCLRLERECRCLPRRTRCESETRDTVSRVSVGPAGPSLRGLSPTRGRALKALVLRSHWANALRMRGKLQDLFFRLLLFSSALRAPEATCTDSRLQPRVHLIRLPSLVPRVEFFRFVFLVCFY